MSQSFALFSQSHYGSWFHAVFTKNTCSTPGESHLGAHHSENLKYHQPPVADKISLPVVKFSPDATLKETAAAVACEDAVVLARARVPAHDARQAQRRFVLDGGWRRRRTRHVTVTGPQQEGRRRRRGRPMCRRSTRGTQAERQGMRTRGRRWITLSLWQRRWHSLWNNRTQKFSLKWQSRGVTTLVFQAYKGHGGRHAFETKALY